jgi:predicted XRE-type DNA-binding protein
MPIDPAGPIYLLRQQLAAEITRALGGPQSQHVISRHYGIPQPRMSELSRGVVQRCTIEWLIRRIYRMDGNVKILVELGDVRRAWWNLPRPRR